MLFYQYLTLNVFPTFYLQIIRCMFIPFLILYHVEFMNVGNIKLKWYQKLGTFYASPVVKFCHEVVSNHRNLWTNTTVFYRLQAWCKQYSIYTTSMVRFYITGARLDNVIKTLNYSCLIYFSTIFAKKV